MESGRLRERQVSDTLSSNQRKNLGKLTED